MRVDQIGPPVMYLPADPSVEGVYVLAVEDFFRREIKGNPGVHARMVVLARLEDGIWRTDTEYGGDSITRPFGLDTHGVKWFAALLTALGVQGEIDVYDDVALTAAMCGKSFTAAVKVSVPKPVAQAKAGPHQLAVQAFTRSKRFVNVTRFSPCPADVTKAVASAGVLKKPPINARVEAP